MKSTAGPVGLVRTTEIALVLVIVVSVMLAAVGENGFAVGDAANGAVEEKPLGDTEQNVGPVTVEEVLFGPTVALGATKTVPMNVVIVVVT